MERRVPKNREFATTSQYMKRLENAEEQWVYLRDLRPGAVFVTREGTYAVKSEYRYSSEPLAQCECILLASGEYAHFRDGNETLVREVREIPKEQE